MNQLKLNADQTQNPLLTNETNSYREFSSKAEAIKPVHAHGNLEVQIDSNLTSEHTFIGKTDILIGPW